MTAPLTQSQRMAQAAYRKIAASFNADLASFARSFPSLIHACGLAQAIAFARAKHKPAYLLYLDHLTEVLHAAGVASTTSAEELEATTRSADVLTYVRLSRTALQAASWLKRYAEAHLEPKP